MMIVQRQQRLHEILRDRKTAQLEDLARDLGVSASTVRRDLEALEQRGVVKRTHGGAVYRGEEREPARDGRGPALSTRMQEQVAQKRAIARYAASLVQPHMTLLMDGGSTVIIAAQHIEARPIQVVTTSLSVANLFKDDDQVELLLAGGSLYPRTEVTVGPITTGTLSELHADLLFFSLAGIYGDGAFNINLSMARVEQVMMGQAARTVMLMDSSKFGRTSLVRVCGLADVDQIVTDDGVGPDWRTRLGDRLAIAAS